MTYAVKFCGGCNPRYDRSGCHAKLEDRIGTRLGSPQESVRYDVVFVICGCPSRCADVSAIQADRFIYLDSPELPEGLPAAE